MVNVKEIKLLGCKCDSCGTKDDKLKYYEIDIGKKRFYGSLKFAICENCIIDLMDESFEFLPNLSGWYED